MIRLYLRAHTRLSINDREKDDDLLYRHFYGPGHNSLEDVSGQLIDRAPNESDLVDKEGQCAYRLKSIKPHGLNDIFLSLHL